MKKRIFSAWLMLAVYLGAFAYGCGGKKEDGTFKGEIRSTYATYKLMQNDQDFVSLGEQLTVDMVKNETEGGQLVITPERNVKEYTVVTHDLKKANGTVFPKSQIQAYVQTYLNITEKTSAQTNMEYPTGYIPDMLLPIELASKEELTIQKGNNQSITLDFTTTSETEAGTYTGFVDLVLGKTTKSIPVTLNVYDITIDKMYGKTSFGLCYNYLMLGEMDSTWDMYIKYYETMLNDYKICASFVPYYDVSANAWADSVVKYYDHPNFTSFSIPYYGYTITESQEMNSELFKDYLYALAQKCTKEKILFDKAYIYMQPNDEPNSPEAYAHVESVIEDINEAKVAVFERLKKENFFNGDSEYENEFKESFYYFENVVTCKYNEELKDVISGYCPHVEFYNTEAGREQYEKTAEISKGEKWFYTAMELYPYPSCAIDDYAIGNRILHWMQKAYDIEGYLYYDVAIYNNFITGEMLNPYTDPVRFSNKSGGYPGDGYIFYPTIKYGAEKPLGSLRGVAYRDGREDLALLNVIEQKVNEVAASYGVSANCNELLSDVYDSIFTGTHYNTDDAAFAAARKAVFAFYETVNGEAGFIPQESVVVGDTATVDVYTAQGVELYCDGDKMTGTASGEGLKYTLQKQIVTSSDVFRVEVKKNGETLVTKNIKTGAIIHSVTELNGDSFAVSEHGNVAVDSANNEVDYVIRSYGESITDKFAFKPYVAVKSNLFNGGVSNVASFTFTVRNDSAQDIEFAVKLKAGSASKQVDTIHVKAGESLTVTVSKLDSLSGAEQIILETDNIDSSNNLLADRNVSIFDMEYTLK